MDKLEELRKLSEKATRGEWSIRTIGLSVLDTEFSIACVNYVREQLEKK